MSYALGLAFGPGKGESLDQSRLLDLFARPRKGPGRWAFVARQGMVATDPWTSMLGRSWGDRVSKTPPWVAGSELSAIWQQDAGETFALSRATHALTIMLAVLAQRGVDRPEVWVPAYFCENGLGPLRLGAAKLRFYPVRDSMAPDWAAAEAMLGVGCPHLFVLPHFFGMENEAAAARVFCDRVGALLHEDAAHLLRPVGEVGRFGDFVSYSPRKYFEVPDAGILVVRGEALADEARGAAAGIKEGDPHRNLRWRALALRDRLVPRRPKSGPLPPRRVDDEPQRVPLASTVWMSPFSRSRIARSGRAGASAIAAREAETVARLEEGLRRWVGLSPLPRHPEATPYMLGFRAANQGMAEETLAFLRRSGADVATWPGLPPEIWAEPAAYGEALAIRRTVLRFTPRYANRRRPLDFLETMHA